MMFNPVKLFIIVAFYIVGAYATTDILRLLRGAQTAVWEKDCYCPACGVRIRLREQIPVWSFLYGRGKCRGCGGKISFSFQVAFENGYWVVLRYDEEGKAILAEGQIINGVVRDNTYLSDDDFENEKVGIVGFAETILT